MKNKDIFALEPYLNTIQKRQRELLCIDKGDDEKLISKTVENIEVNSKECQAPAN